MKKVVEFFLKKIELNYTMFIFITILGIFSYISIPKDVFPPIKIDKISISGGYAGASIDILDKMAVSKLEDELKSLTGVTKLESFIKNSSFSIVLELDKSADKYSVLNKAKDIISNNRRYFPTDMDEPTANIVDLAWPLINVTISSDIESKDSLIDIGKDIKTKLSAIENISNVELYEDSDIVYEIIFDDRKLQMYNLNRASLIESMKLLSYIYPIGKIEDKREHLFVSTYNGKKSVDEFLNTVIKVENKSIYLSDIAFGKMHYQESDIVSKFNGKLDVSIGVSKNEYGNAMELVKIIKSEIAEFNKLYPTVEISTFYDTSVYIRNRLNTVTSSIMFGLILVAFSIYILINKRVAFIVTLGIPTSILMGVIFLYLFDYSINMMTLLGALLIIGVLVDDAIIIAENIQRHIVLGDSKYKSALLGVKEVIAPVTVSTITTIFAFMPMLMISGEMGEFFKMIPISIVALLIASLIESFVFLPLHGLHLLSANDRELDWTKVQNIYQSILKKFIKYRKTFLTIFIILVPVITFFLTSQLKFQLFPEFDSDRVFIKGKFSVNHTEEQVYKKIKIIESKLLENREKLGIKSISMMAGFRTDNMGNPEIKQNVFEFNIELFNKTPENFVDKYVTPNLSFDYDESLRIRELNSKEIELYIKEMLKDFKPNGLEEFAIKKEGAGMVNNDIEIFINANSKEKILSSIQTLKSEISKIDGVIFVDDSAKEGVKELKLKVNKYGEDLGFSETYIASILSSYFLEAEQSKALNRDGIVEIITYSRGIDNFETLKNFEISIPNRNSKILLSDICTFIYISSFDSIYKEDGIDMKSVFANVDKDIITPMEVLKIINPAIEKLKESGVGVKLKGEQEQNEQVMKDMAVAFIVAIFFIFMILLIMFNSFKYTLIVLSIIPFSMLGAIVGHLIMDMKLTMPSVIGILGLAGVVINDGIVMLDFIKNAKTLEELLQRAKLRLRPIIITSITTFIGLSVLIFFASGQAKILQPIAVSLGFGLMWGTILNLIYLPVLFAVGNGIKALKSEI